MITLNGVGIRELEVFDPTDIPRLFAQDEMIERGWADGFKIYAEHRSNEVLSVQAVACREALKLPFCERFLGFIGGEWARAQEEISARLYLLEGETPYIYHSLPVV